MADTSPFVSRFASEELLTVSKRLGIFLADVQDAFAALSIEAAPNPDDALGEAGEEPRRLC